jgi:hypothetical protein
MTKATKKLYCYVDETGQDAGSELFIVVAVVVTSDVNAVRERLQELEKKTNVSSTKWHKSSHKYRIKFMEAFLSQGSEGLHVYFVKARKPVSYHTITLEILQKVLSANSTGITRVIVCIDGLSKTSGKQFTSALRTPMLKIKLTNGVRDESEILIRLADRWAGCLRMALGGNEQCGTLLARAERNGVLTEI